MQKIEARSKGKSHKSYLKTSHLGHLKPTSTDRRFVKTLIKYGLKTTLPLK